MLRSNEPPPPCSDGDTTGDADAAILNNETSPGFAAPRYRAATAVAISLWGLTVAAGYLYGFWYELTPAETGVVADRWPAASACTLSENRPTLLMFVHPHCPCSRASLDELALLMSHCRGRVNAQVLFFQPRSASVTWAKTDLWDKAVQIPEVKPHLDFAGAEHRCFGARVSGEVFLYRPSGELAFHGGITAGRGHAGDNEGRWALESFLLHRHSSTITTPVFGCALESSASFFERRPKPGTSDCRCLEPNAWTCIVRNGNGRRAGMSRRLGPGTTALNSTTPSQSPLSSKGEAIP